jgi:lycopene cyclase domain-containing protein
MALTYLSFLAAFVAPPLVGLAGLAVARSGSREPSLRLQAGGVGLLVALALVYTTPWDNYLIAQGVWWYGEGRVAATIWNAPVGEYLFIAGQAVLVGLWTFRLAGPVDASIGHSWPDRAGGALAGLAVSAVGFALLAGPQSGYYLGAILAWAGPVLALQWGVGWRYLLAIRRRVAVGVAVPVVYLSAIDRLAIADGIWTISPAHTTGLAVAGLPIEEAVFFLVTSLFVVQALTLLRWVLRRWG